MIRFRSFAAFLAALILLFTALPAEGSDYDVMEMEDISFEELIPETQAGSHANLGTLTFAVGFTVMMGLDCALG